jgi:hypothetical protein
VECGSGKLPTKNPGKKCNADKLPEKMRSCRKMAFLSSCGGVRAGTYPQARETNPIQRGAGSEKGKGEYGSKKRESTGCNFDEFI